MLQHRHPLMYSIAFDAAKAFQASFSPQHACKAEISPIVQPEGRLASSRPSNVLHQPCGIRLLSCMLHRSRVCRASCAESVQVPVRSPPTPSWIHDFPVTQNYAVLPESPVVFNLKVGHLCQVTRGCCAVPVCQDWAPVQDAWVPSPENCRHACAFLTMCPSVGCNARSVSPCNLLQISLFAFALSALAQSAYHLQSSLLQGASHMFE